MCERVAANPGAIDVSGLQAVWTTPNQIRWQWQASGAGEDLFRFELLVAESEADLLAESGTTIAWTPEQNPELAQFLLPQTGAGDPVISTTTFDHQPNTDYFARLSAIDTQKRRSTTAIAAARTTIPAANQLTLFADQLSPGHYPSGDIAPAISSEHPHAGSECLVLLNACDAVASCFHQFGVGGLGDVSALSDDTGKSMSQGAFETTAYAEFAVSNEGSVPGFWAQFRLGFGPDGATKHFNYDTFTIRTAGAAGDYRVYQVPLRALLRWKQPDQAISYADLQSPLRDVQVGARWDDGATVRLDSLSLKW